jgi:hypothetical protein
MRPFHRVPAALPISGRIHRKVWPGNALAVACVLIFPSFERRLVRLAGLFVPSTVVLAERRCDIAGDVAQQS